MNVHICRNQTICSINLWQTDVSLLAKPVSCNDSIPYRPSKIKRLFCHFFIVFHPQGTSFPKLKTLSLPIFQRFRPIFVRAYNPSKFLNFRLYSFCLRSNLAVYIAHIVGIPSFLPVSPSPRKQSKTASPPFFGERAVVFFFRL